MKQNGLQFSYSEERTEMNSVLAAKEAYRTIRANLMYSVPQ